MLSRLELETDELSPTVTEECLGVERRLVEILVDLLMLQEVEVAVEALDELLELVALDQGPELDAALLLRVPAGPGVSLPELVELGIDF